jgi:GDPmannose 4,6-dehydratase
MWLMLQQDKPRDLVIGTGLTFSVEDFVTRAFESGVELTGRDLPKEWSEYVNQDSTLQRPADIYSLQADTVRAAALLGWRSTVAFYSLIRMMMKHDLKEEGVIE